MDCSAWAGGGGGREDKWETCCTTFASLMHSVMQPTYAFNPLMQQTEICVQAQQRDNKILSLKSKWLHQYYTYRACWQLQLQDKAVHILHYYAKISQFTKMTIWCVYLLMHKVALAVIMIMPIAQSLTIWTSRQHPVLDMTTIGLVFQYFWRDGTTKFVSAFGSTTFFKIFFLYPLTP
jgi:hypothetical protein